MYPPRGTITVGAADVLPYVANPIDGARATDPTTRVAASTHVLMAAVIASI